MKMGSVISSEGMGRDSSRPSSPSPKGALIRELRLRRNLRQDDVAARAGISPTQLSRIETGKHQPGRKTLERLAPILGVSAAYLDAEALSDAVIERATDPEARAFVERVLSLHDRIAFMTPDEREELFKVVDAQTRKRRRKAGGGSER
jgi:transcriptional regulator with XRE-family HTH domain